MFKSLYYLILACRPLTLFVATLPVSLAITLVVKDKLFAITPEILPANIIISLNILIVAGLIQIISNLANDYFDFKKGTDQQLTGRRKVLPTKLVHPKFFLIFLLNICFLTVILAIPLVILGGIPIIAIGISAIILAFFYSATKYSLANNYLSELFIFLYFGPLATAGTYYLLTVSLTIPALAIGVCSGLLGIALLEVNNLRDYQTDLNAGRKNLVTKFGIKENLRFLNYLYFTTPFFLLFFGLKWHIWLLIIPAFCYAVYLSYLTRKTPINYKLLFFNTIGLIFLLQVLSIAACILRLN